MQINVREKLYNVVYASPDSAEALLSVVKIVWGMFLLFSVERNSLFDRTFYFDTSDITSRIVGLGFILLGMLKMWVWLQNTLIVRKKMALIGMCLWIFIWYNTYLSILPGFALIPFTLFVVVDFWLYLRLGALGNDHTNRN